MKPGGLRAGFDPFARNPVEFVASPSPPLFISPGGNDGLIPIEHSRRIFEASNAETKVWREVPTGRHHDVLAEGGDDLYTEMVLFYLEHLAGITAPGARGAGGGS